MQELIQKIEADAAERLVLGAGRLATQELPRFKTFLKMETHRLKMKHRAGEPGRAICRARAAIIDVILRYLWMAAKANLSEQETRRFPEIAVVALGGYGRSELNPHSDIDFMFLHHGQVEANAPLPVFSRLIDGILYPLWDLGLKVGHSARTIEDCVKLANTDMQSKTSLIEARLVTGDEKLFQKFEKTLIAKCVEGFEEEYLRMRLDDQAARRARFGNSACMQEPNVKNGCGGLRDFQNLLWMSFFKYRTRSLRELQQKEFVTDQERQQLRAAYDFLLRVRTEMHYHVNRGMDVLSKNIQPAVAHNLGYKDRSPSQRIEVFMRDVYIHSRNIFLITRTLEQRMALQPGARSSGLSSLRKWIPDYRRQAALPPPIDGFRVIDGEIQPANPRIMREQPRRFMRVFLYAQQRGARLHPDLAQLIRNQISILDRSFLTDEHIRETFLTILGQRGDVGRVLRAMHEVGLLGKYIPEFGKLTCLVQHEFYHQYAADEHTLMCIEQLDKIWEAPGAPHNAYTPLLHSLERPFILYLALLLHDVGKAAAGKDHSQASARLAMRVARRLGLDGAATHSLRLLIEHHLLMASTSQRRDLDDPAVIRMVASKLQTPEHVTLLTLHSFVDAQATSDKLWNGFKDSLLWSLHKKTMALMTGATEFHRAEEKQRELLLAEVLREKPKNISVEEVDAHFVNLPPRYFQIHAAREILEDIVLAHLFMHLQLAEEDTALQPVVNWFDEPDRGFTAVKVCTWDRAGLFRKIAGSLSAAGLNILSAQIFTRKDGIVVDTFYVTDARSGGLGTSEQQRQFESVLEGALVRGVDFPSLISRQKNARPLYQAYAGEQIPISVAFDNESSEDRTLIEIETEDRVGLLYYISEALAELDLDIAGAKISTEKGAAIDTFYVRELDGSKVGSKPRRDVIERKIRATLSRLDRVK